MILGVIVVLLAQLTHMAGDTWRVGEKQANNLSKARSMLDLIAQDIQLGVFRNDLAAFPVSSGSSILAFYTRRSGISGTNSTRDVSLVTYSINTSSSNSTLQRGDMAVQWTDASTVIPFGAVDGNFSGNLSSVVMRDTVPGVVGLKVIFLYGDGSLSLAHTTGSSSGVKAIGVALAVMDDQTLKLVNHTSLQTICNAFDAAATGTTGIKADWDAFLTNRSFWANYPKALPSGIQVLERYVPLQ